MNTQTKFLRDCAKRTPIYKPDTPAMDIAAGICFAILFLTLAFI